MYGNTLFYIQIFLDYSFECFLSHIGIIEDFYSYFSKCSYRNHGVLNLIVLILKIKINAVNKILRSE